MYINIKEELENALRHAAPEDEYIRIRKEHAEHILVAVEKQIKVALNGNGETGPMFCPNCGSIIEDLAAKHCWQCGQKFEN